MKIKIDKIIYPGKSLSKTEGKVVFTDEGLPGEYIEAELVKNKKNYLEAKVSAILDPSKHRVRNRCKHYRICSPYQYIQYDEQLRIKKSQLEEIFLHDLKIKTPSIAFRRSPKEWGYRNKIHLRLIWDGRSPGFAYISLDREKTLHKIDGCSLASEEVNDLMDILLEVIKVNRLDFIEEVIIRENHKKEILLIFLGSKEEEKERLLLSFEEKSAPPHIKGLIYVIKGSEHVINLWGQDFLTEEIKGRSFEVGALSFFQVNAEALKCLIDDMYSSLAFTGDEKMVDLYCGVGTFGILFSDKVKEVSGVESSKANIVFLKENLLLNNIENFDVNKNTCEKAIKEILKKKPDIIIVDPPRKGLDNSLIDALLREPVSKIAYISCNPSTLSRDLKKLLLKYKISKIFGYDFFPHTPHIETFTLLETPQ
ncbi:MAG: 23S rRNA (uracil(1939)-C(5))-methyltransferase RlmD [Candidatus Omnitrophota bacterium]